MTTLPEHVDDYLRLRRALGFKLQYYGEWLTNFAAYVDATGTGSVTSERAVSWA
jgi:integrase/recombinase XerD